MTRRPRAGSGAAVRSGAAWAGPGGGAGPLYSGRSRAADPGGGAVPCGGADRGGGSVERCPGRRRSPRSAAPAARLSRAAGDRTASVVSASSGRLSGRYRSTRANRRAGPPG